LIDVRILQILNQLSPETSIDMTQLMNELSKLEVQSGQNFSNLLTPTTTALILLRDTMHPNKYGKMDRSILTCAQRQHLTDWLNEQFPQLAEGTPEENWTNRPRWRRCTLGYSS